MKVAVDFSEPQTNIWYVYDSEILRSAVEVDKLSHYLQGFKVVQNFWTIKNSTWNTKRLEDVLAAKGLLFGECKPS